MIRKSGSQFSEKIMLKQKDGVEHDSIQLKHALAVVPNPTTGVPSLLLLR
jgi:hypothetical protein